MLKIVNTSVAFGGLQALKNVSVEVQRGKITALIGPNGAGKSTLMNTISGFTKPDTGEIIFKDQDITEMRPFESINLGLARTFQDLEVMQQLTVAENVLLGIPKQMAKKIWRLFLTPKSTNADFQQAVQKTVNLLEQVGLLEKADVLASELSYGEQKMLVLARLLATEAELLMLDEPGAGLPDKHLHQIGETLKNAVLRGKTVLLVDHNMDLIMTYADVVTVLHHGEVIATGSPAEIKADQRVIDVYFSNSDRTSEEVAK